MEVPERIAFVRSLLQAPQHSAKTEQSYKKCQQEERIAQLSQQCWQTRTDLLVGSSILLNHSSQARRISKWLLLPQQDMLRNKAHPNQCIMRSNPACQNKPADLFNHRKCSN